MKNLHSLPSVTSNLLARFSLLIGLLSLPLTAATVPYQDDFQTTTAGTLPSGWLTTGNETATWTTVNTGSSQVLQATSTNTTATGSYAAFQQFGNIDASLKDFTITSTFTITDAIATTANEYIGFVAFGSSTSLGSYYLADIRGNGGLIRILSIGSGSSSFTAGTSVNLSADLVAGTQYTMTLTGSFVGSMLELTYSVTDGVKTATATGTDTAPRTGEYFGLRLNNNSSNDTLQTQFSDYSITSTSTIPEPADTAMLVGVTMLGFLAVRRLRRKA